MEATGRVVRGGLGMDRGLEERQRTVMGHTIAGDLSAELGYGARAVLTAFGSQAEVQGGPSLESGLWPARLKMVHGILPVAELGITASMACSGVRQSGPSLPNFQQYHFTRLPTRVRE